MLQQLIQQITPLTLTIIGTLVLSFGVILIVTIAYRRTQSIEERPMVFILSAILTTMIGVLLMLLAIILLITT